MCKVSEHNYRVGALENVDGEARCNGIGQRQALRSNIYSLSPSNGQGVYFLFNTPLSREMSILPRLVHASIYPLYPGTALCIYIGPSRLAQDQLHRAPPSMAGGSAIAPCIALRGREAIKMHYSLGPPARRTVHGTDHFYCMPESPIQGQGQGHTYCAP